MMGHSSNLVGTMGQLSSWLGTMKGPDSPPVGQVQGAQSALQLVRYKGPSQPSSWSGTRGPVSPPVRQVQGAQSAFQLIRYKGSLQPSNWSGTVSHMQVDPKVGTVYLRGRQPFQLYVLQGKELSIWSGKGEQAACLKLIRYAARYDISLTTPQLVRYRSTVQYSSFSRCGSSL
jgi:hypothetical protein